MEPKLHTVGELRRDMQKLLDLPDETRVGFGDGQLSLQRLKVRGPFEGPPVIWFEFNESYSVKQDSDER